MAIGLPLLAFIVCESRAQTDELGWSGEIYGGEFYDDRRAGAYFAMSQSMAPGPTFIGEMLFERYTDYDFAGLGAHFLWPIGTFGELGLSLSQAWETYEVDPNLVSNYQTRMLGAEWEFEQGPFALALQAGKYLKDYSGNEPGYFSADAYFWGEQRDWYLRASTRRIADASLSLIEGYRLFQAYEHAVTAYAGVSRDDLDTITPGSADSVYVGAYMDLFSTPKTNLSLWFEAAKQEDDTLLTIELNLAFGPGARTPYITAFGYSLDN